MSIDATVLRLEDVKVFRGICDEYVASLEKGLKRLVQATDFVHQGSDGWDDSDYERIKNRVDGIIVGMQAIKGRIKTDLIPYVDDKICVLERKPNC